MGKLKLSAKTLIVIGIFSAYALLMFFNYIAIAQLIVDSNLIVALIIYIVFNPAYLLIIYGMWAKYRHRSSWKRILASILSVLSLDFLAVPRLSINDILTNGAAVSTNIGSIIMRTLETVFPHDVSYMIMYLILPIIGFAISVELLGITNFMKERT